MARSIIQEVIRKARSQKNYKFTIASIAGVDMKAVDSLIDIGDEKVLNAVQLMTGSGGDVPLIPTYPTRFIQKIIDICLWDQRSYMLWGPPGCGKTITSRESVRTLQNDINTIGLVTVNEFNKGNAKMFMRDATGGFGIVTNRNTNRRAYIPYTLITDYFKVNRGLLIIDEAHRLRTNVYNAVRDLVDATKLSLIMLGTDEFTENLDKQFLGRLKDKYEIPMLTIPDVKKFIGFYGIEIDDSESRSIIKKIKSYRNLATLKFSMDLIAENANEGDFSWKSVDGQTIIDAIDRHINKFPIVKSVDDQRAA
jgi:hypothetical protein